MNDELTLRDYFAAAALTGLFSSGGMSSIQDQANRTGIKCEKHLASLAYDCADAMLAERAKQPANSQPKEDHAHHS